SLRIYARHSENKSLAVLGNVASLLEKEQKTGLLRLDYYLDFQPRADRIKYDVLGFLLEQKQSGKKVAAYGAAAKGNTLLNYCGVKNDMIEFVADANPHKQNKYMPASHIPVVDEVQIKNNKPDYVIILPWNLKDEIISQL